MTKSKHIDKICIAVISIMLVITVLFMFGEKLGIAVIHHEESETTNEMFTANDLNADWDTSNASKITLSGDSATVSGNGAYFSNDTLYIAYAGKYVLSGTLNGSICIDADGDDKIWLLFDGVNITSTTDAPLNITQADKVFVTLKENSENTLTFENSDEEADTDGAIFSRDDLTINGNGNLTIVSSNLHGIVCNDSLVFTGGNINLTAKKDGVHAHDAIKICNTDITVTAEDDGLHAGNDDESSLFYLESGNINITKCYEGIEANDITIAGGTVKIIPSDDGLNANGSGANSQITITGGDITVTNESGRDADGFDSNGSINITGGNILISVVGSGTNNALDYGSENGGKCTISGGTVVACGSSEMSEGPDGDSEQGFIMQTVSGNANETISLLDKNEKEIISKEIPCSFTSIIISSPNISVGDTVTLVIGDAKTEISVDNSSVNGGMGGMKNGGGFDPNQNTDERKDDDSSSRNMPTPPSGDTNGTPPEKPDGDDSNTFTQMPNGNEERPTPPNFNSNDNQSDAFGGMREPPNGDMNENAFSDFGGGEKQEPSNESENNETQLSNNSQSIENESDKQESTNIFIYVLISFFVLIGGIIIAVKKKY